MLVILFFMRKTAYEIRISDWSSDVCSSDLQWRGQDQYMGGDLAARTRARAAPRRAGGHGARRGERRFRGLCRGPGGRRPLPGRAGDGDGARAAGTADRAHQRRTRRGDGAQRMVGDIVADPRDGPAVRRDRGKPAPLSRPAGARPRSAPRAARSEKHTSELQSLMRSSYAVFCLKKKKKTNTKSNVIDKLSQSQLRARM